MLLNATVAPLVDMLPSSFSSLAHTPSMNYELRTTDQQSLVPDLLRLHYQMSLSAARAWQNGPPTNDAAGPSSICSR